MNSKPSTSSWIACNACGRQPRSDLRLFLTNCGHLICQRCVSSDRSASSSSLKCCVCGQRCSLKELNAKLDKDLLEYFTDPAIVFERRIAAIKRTIDFQNVHRANLQKRHLEERKYMAKMQQYINAEKEKKSRLTRELDEVNEKFRQQEEEIRRLRSSAATRVSLMTSGDPCAFSTPICPSSSSSSIGQRLYPKTSIPGVRKMF